jgi:hypothetical protein
VVLRLNTPQNIDSIDYAATRIRMGVVGGSWETATPMFEGKADTCNLGWLQAGQLMFYAAHVNSAGDTSTPAVTSLVILPPAQPIVTGDVWIDQVELRWTPSETTQPLRGYEVRVGPILIEAMVLTISDAIGYVYTPPNPGTHMFWVTAIDLGGNRSAPGYVELTTLPHISEAIAELQEGLDDVLQQLDDLPAYEDRWGVRVVSANGPKVGGIILGNDGQQADFIVLSDRFAWALPDGSGVKYPLVLGTIAGVPSFGFAGNMYVDGAIQARMIGVDQLRAEHIRSTEIEVRHLKAEVFDAMAVRVAVSANLLANSTLVTTIGWNFDQGNLGANTSGALDVPDDNWRPIGGHTLCIHQPNDWFQGQNLVAQWYTDVIPCEGSKRYQFSASVAAHRCPARIQIVFYDSAGTVVLAVQSSDALLTGGTALSNYSRVGGFAVSPAGAVSMRLFFYKFPTVAGGGDSYAWLTQPMIAVASPYQTIPTAYSASGQGTIIDERGIRTTSLGAINQNLGVVVNGRLVSTDNQMTIDLDSKVIEMNWGGRRVRIDTNGFAFGPTGGAPKLFYNAATDELTLNGTFTADAINAVNTINIAGGAVTAKRFASSSGMASQGITMASGSSGVVIRGVVHATIVPVGEGTTAELTVGIFRDASNAELSSARVGLPFGGGSQIRLSIPLDAFDAFPIAGWNTYSLRLIGSSAGVIHGSTITLEGGQR